MKCPTSRSAALLLASLMMVAGMMVAGARGPALAGGDQLAYGAHLAQECMACHRTDETEKVAGIPPIVGMEAGYFIEAMEAYRSGVRTNQAMMSVARSLDEDQLRALAAYLATLVPAGKRQTGQ